MGTLQMGPIEQAYWFVGKAEDLHVTASALLGRRALHGIRIALVNLDYAFEVAKARLRSELITAQDAEGALPPPA